VAEDLRRLRLDTETLCAALLHDTVEDTSASLDEVRERFGDEIATLVDGVTKLTGITFTSRDEAQAENYRKMMVAMATDIRVILIKLADRLHNMRTIGAMSKQKQIEKAKETLEIYAPIAHRLGIHAMKWELEDLAFAALHPRKYQEIKGLVNQQREEREDYVRPRARTCTRELEALGIHAEIFGRAKHFYSIYSKMTKKGREFNEIYDLTAMRVIVDSVKDTYGAVGVIHSLWKPLPGRFKDFIAMPKFNMYQSLHTTVIGPEGLPLEIQIRTREMHDMAEFGVAAHWIYKEGPAGAGKPAPEGESKLKWLRSMLDWQQELQDPKEFMENLKVDLFDEEVFVFTPEGRGQVAAAGATPLDFAYEIHTELGHRCVGAKVNSKIVPLNYQLQVGRHRRGADLQARARPVARLARGGEDDRARNKIKQWFKQESRQDTEHSGRALLQEALTKAGPAAAEDRRLAAARPTSSARWASARRGLLRRARRREDLDEGRRQQGADAPEAGRGGRGRAGAGRGARLARAASGASRPGRATPTGIRVEGVDDVMLRLAKCCRPVPGDPIVGYVSLGRGITIHRDDCPNTAALRKDPERFVRVHWEGEHEKAFKVELQVDAWDRHRLLEDLSRTFAEAGCNIVEARCIVSSPMVQNRFVVEVADTQGLSRRSTAAQHRRRVRRLPRHAGCRLIRRRPARGRHRSAGRRRRPDLRRHRAVAGDAPRGPARDRRPVPVCGDRRAARVLTNIARARPDRPGGARRRARAAGRARRDELIAAGDAAPGDRARAVRPLCARLDLRTATVRPSSRSRWLTACAPTASRCGPTATSSSAAGVSRTRPSCAACAGPRPPPKRGWPPRGVAARRARRLATSCGSTAPR
jgi:GTP pyrophosphokinase